MIITHKIHSIFLIKRKKILHSLSFYNLNIIFATGQFFYNVKLKQNETKTQSGLRTAM